MAALSPDAPQAKEVRAAVETLIATVATGDMSVLDRIYHPNMEVFLFAPNGEVHSADKPGFIDQMKASVAANGPPSTWAKFHAVTADATRGHVIVSRKAKLSENEQIITLSIDFVREDGRWQIIREVVRV